MSIKKSNLVERFNFTQPNQYSISTLIPTRKRPDKLRRSVASLVDLADIPDKLEIMIAVDDDDAETLESINQDLHPWLKSRQVPHRVVTMPRQGYINLQNYYNTLAENSSCDWYFMWGDDSVIKTQGWDSIIRHHDGEFRILRVRTHNEHPYSIFPIIPRDWFKLVGMLGNHQMGDAVVSQMAYMLDIMHNVEIDVDHNRFDLVGEKPDEVYQQRVLLEGNPSDPRDLNSSKNVFWRYSMCDRIAWYLQSRGHDISWWNNVKAGIQDPWEKLKANDPNGQTCQNVVIRK